MGPLGEAELELGKSGTGTGQKGVSEMVAHLSAVASRWLWPVLSCTGMPAGPPEVSCRQEGLD